MHVKLITRVTLLDDLEAKADSRTSFRYSIVWVSDVESKKFTIIKIHEGVVVEVIGSKLKLLFKYDFELVHELYFDSVVVFYVGDCGNVPRLC